jgi:hypothetical protein
MEKYVLHWARMAGMEATTTISTFWIYDTALTWVQEVSDDDLE